MQAPKKGKEATASKPGRFDLDAVRIGDGSLAPHFCNFPKLAPFAGKVGLLVDPGPLPPRIVVAAARPQGPNTEFGWRTASLEHLVRDISLQSAVRMDGAAQAIMAMAHKYGGAADLGMVLIAEALADQAALLRAAHSAQRDLAREEQEARGGEKKGRRS